MAIEKLMTIACLLFTPALSFADEHAVKYCYLKVRLGNEILAHRKLCIEGDEYSFEVSGLQVTFQLLKRGGQLEVGPNNFVFFNGKGTQFVNANPQGALAPFYDTSSEGYIDGAFNQSAGAISFTVQGE